MSEKQEFIDCDECGKQMLVTFPEMNCYITEDDSIVCPSCWKLILDQKGISE
jgi:DNA-directed RNA polymerase subunit RPC12/RpoP